MKSFDIHYVCWLLGRFAKKLGVFGLLGVALIVTCGLLFVTNILPATKQLDNAKYALAQVQKATERSQEILPAPELSEKTTTQDVTEFYKLFPTGASLPKQLELIEKTALKQQLTLNRGDYKLTKTKQDQLMRYEIVFPLIGSYTQIRQFIATVLQELPALALSDLQIKRENAMSPMVQARLVFTLFLQGDSWLK